MRRCARVCPCVRALRQVKPPSESLQRQQMGATCTVVGNVGGWVPAMACRPRLHRYIGTVRLVQKRANLREGDQHGKHAAGATGPSAYLVPPAASPWLWCCPKDVHEGRRLPKQGGKQDAVMLSMSSGR